MRRIALNEIGIKLYDHQKEALTKMKKGCILNGGVGSGKSLTSLAYFRNVCEDGLRDLYIITTATKRDKHEWESDMGYLGLRLGFNEDFGINVVIDSWNNIKKYADVHSSFFIFDEDRVTGSGVWVKSFYNIARKNHWIILSATPGDTWEQYIPVFVANGFYKNVSEFRRNHIIYSQWCKYPKIERYIDEGILIRHRNDILIDMDFKKSTTRHVEDVICDYNRIIYKDVLRNRWDIFNNKPIRQASELCYVLRKVVNTDLDRQETLIELINSKKIDKVIIFYNFDYELEILKSLDYGKRRVAEWNGHAHQPIPATKRWVYLVQYTSGCEGWNCIDTDSIIFYSQNYSYRVIEQAMGRIDRINTPYPDLYYYIFKSNSSIDIAIARAVKAKRMFNIRKFTGG